MITNATTTTTSSNNDSGPTSYLLRENIRLHYNTHAYSGALRVGPFLLESLA
ncbi:MAG TPA: hypothetical protein VKX96_16490 [Chloroflexota bacterium]|nr:hypothetical protein [Chloroflexota bacterium]